MQNMTPEQAAERYQGRRRPGGDDPLAAAGRRSAVKPTPRPPTSATLLVTEPDGLRASFRDGKYRAGHGRASGPHYPVLRIGLGLLGR
jgi:hypothetical protein